jgi:feruloyl esterase
MTILGKYLVDRALTKYVAQRLLLMVAVGVVVNACTLGNSKQGITYAHKRIGCAQLSSLQIDHTRVTDAEDIPAGQYRAPNGQVYQVPNFCRVHLLATPASDSAINIAVWLPVTTRNGRYHQHGEGGMGGAINYASLAKLLSEGNAVAATDDGHTRTADGSAVWAKQPQKVIDGFGRALKKTRDAAVALIAAYYGQAPAYRYFSGCSGGGRQAFIAAQRYPNDWDGILAGAPSFDTTGQYTSAAVMGQRWRNYPKGRIAPEKLPMIQRTALAACSSEAHVVDGIAGDPRFCLFDAKSLACSGAETNQCLTAPEQRTLNALYQGAVYRDAMAEQPRQKRFPGIAPTMEMTGDLKDWVTGGTSKNTMPPFFLTSANNFFRNFIYQNKEWDVAEFDVEKDYMLARNRPLNGRALSSVIDATSENLNLFRESGAKLIVYSGWGDVGVLPDGVIKYYEKVAKTMGGLEQTRQFFRLFMVPGMGHCSGGPGANAFGQRYGLAGVRSDRDHDIVQALQGWVEDNHAPEKIIAAKYINDERVQGVAFTRPLCAYPQVRVYIGAGDKDKAVNYRCETGASPSNRDESTR